MDPVERVKNMVRHTLVVKPDVSNRELLDRAREIAPDVVDGMTLRQFHGKFRLPIVRFEMTPKRPKKNGTADQSAASNGAKSGTAQEQKAATSQSKPRQKRSRRKTAVTPEAMTGAVRKVLIDFAVELEKAESRSELVSVIAGVDTFVERIVDAASNANTKRSAA